MSNLLIQDFILRIYSRRPRIVVNKFPSRDGTIFFYTTAYFNYSTRPEVSPCKFFLSCPYYPNRFFCFLRQTCRFYCSFATVFASISRSCVGHYYSHLFLRDSENFCQVFLHTKRTLRSCPHR